MNVLFHTAIVAGVVILSASCTKTALYEQNVKSLDSLSGAINSVVRDLDKVDTIVLQKCISRYAWYADFVEQNINDTITRQEADRLHQFYTSGQVLENFSFNRKRILQRAVTVNAQLSKLGEDINGGAITQEQLSAYTLREKNEATRLIDLAYRQQRLYHSSLETFKNTLRDVEVLIRSRNKGELPTIIKDTVTL